MRNTGKCFLLLLCMLPAFASAAAAAPPAPRDPIAVGVDVGTTAAGAVMGAVAAGASVDLPLAHSLSVTIEPSVYWAAGTGQSIFQLTAVGGVRFYLMSLFIPESRRRAQWGPFAFAGIALAWARQTGSTTFDTICFGPNVAVGYRLVFGDRGFFLEPTVGWMALYGAQLDESGATSSANSGVCVGFMLGYRF